MCYIYIIIITTTEDIKMKIGNQVTIHPHLTTDPNKKQGQKGIIKGIDEDIITVLFPDGTTGRYLDMAILEYKEQ